MTTLCPKCESLKDRIAETIRASIEVHEAWEQLPPELGIDLRSVTAMNEQVQRVAIEDYSRHIRKEHFTPLGHPNTNGLL